MSNNQHQDRIPVTRTRQKFEQGDFSPEVVPYIEGLLEHIDDLYWVIEFSGDISGFETVEIELNEQSIKELHLLRKAFESATMRLPSKNS